MTIFFACLGTTRIQKSNLLPFTSDVTKHYEINALQQQL